MKQHAERIRHLQQLEADLDRQIADAQRLQRRHAPPVGGTSDLKAPVSKPPRGPARSGSRGPRKHR